ncbi:MAG TPA: hypothetical protein VF688_13675 [Allosphingosinicella sp.]|jgi:hypothetical protein
MPKLEAAIAGALSLLLLASCGGKAPAEADNVAATVQGDAVGAEPVQEPAQPGAPANSTDEPVPPPDAVSHPNGYLPPVPAEPEPAGANSDGTDRSPPATEDQYIRNGQ